MGCLEMMCPPAKFLGPLVPEINHPGNTMSQEWFISVIICIIQYVCAIQNDMDVSMQGHCVSGTNHFGDQESQKICSGAHRFGTSHHPTALFECSRSLFAQNPVYKTLNFFRHNCVLYCCAPKKSGPIPTAPCTILSKTITYIFFTDQHIFRRFRVL